MSERPESAIALLQQTGTLAYPEAEEVCSYITHLEAELEKAEKDWSVLLKQANKWEVMALNLKVDSKRLDKLDVMKIASLETVFYAIQRDFPVPVREAIDRVDLGEGEQ